MSTPFPAPPRLPALLLAGALAACEALDPLPGPAIVEQPADGTLPGPGTYALVAEPAVSPDNAVTSQGGMPSGEPDSPSGASDAPSGKQAVTAPPLHNADGPASGLMAPPSGTGTLVAPEDSATLAESLEPVAPQPRPLSPEDRRTVEAALVRALERRGYRPSPPEQAAWLVSIDSAREQRREYLAPASKQMLLPRMRCDPQGCMITEQWEHFGPPLRGEALRRYQVDVVEVRIHNGQSGELAWQGRLSSEPGDDGHPSRHDLDKALRRLLRELPAAPRHKPLAEPVQADAGAPAAP